VPATFSKPGLARLITISLLLVAFAIALIYAGFFVFSRSMSLDEGYLMITVQGFNGGHALYDDLYTQYGPFYYFYEWLLRSVLHVPLTHDATRFICMAHWLFASALLGVTAWKLTRSNLAGLFVGAQAIVHLSPLAHEPGHPQEVIAVLLSLGVLAASRLERGRLVWWSLGIITALIAFTKINVGVFFGFALLLAMRCHSTDRLARGAWNLLPLGLCAALPFLLMRQHAGEEWCRNLGIAVACTTISVYLAGKQTAFARNFDLRVYWKTLAAFAATAGILITITFSTGSSWHGLLNGLLLTPLKMPRVTLLHLAMPNGVVLNGGVALTAAMVVIRYKADGRISIVLSGLKLTFAIAGAFCLLGNANAQLSYLLPWIWLVILPPSVVSLNREESFSRILIALVTAWQSLQTYPIAGTQVTLATSFLVLTYGVCLADALRMLAEISRIQIPKVALTPKNEVLMRALAGTALLFVFANLWCKLPALRREYSQLLPLDLPGSRFIRMDEEIVTMNQQLTRYLETECDTFVSYPGIHSLYFWTGKTPPTQINSTGWGQLTHDQQRQIFNSLRHARRPKLVVTEALMRGWETPYADPIRPLVSFVTEECRPVKRIGRCLIFEPKAAAQLTAKQP
jgi:hypothetical protein